MTTEARGSASPSRGAEVARWIEKFLVHAEGDYFGRPFMLAPFEREFLEKLYRVDSAGRRVVRRALLGLPKGNGKTELAAAIAIAELAGPFAPTSPIVIIAAAAFEQADLVFGAARTMIVNGPLEPYFESFDTEILRRDGRPGVMRRIAAAAGTNDGARPTAVIADELHEWVGARERVHLVTTNGLSKRRDGLELNITTAGADRDSLLGRLYDHGRSVTDPSFLFDWRAASDGYDLSAEKQLRAAIREANPACEAGFLSEDRLVARFAEIPRFEFERYHLNRWVEADEAWIGAAAWAACTDPGRAVEPQTSIVIGFDGSATRDNTALIGATIEERPHLFVIGIWERDPHDPSWSVPRGEVDARVADAMRRYAVRQMACDPAGWYGEVQSWATEYGETVVIQIPQTNERMAPAADAFRVAVLAGELTQDGDARVARAIANARTRETRWGIGIRKDHPASPRKIDPAVAAVIAFAACHVEPAPVSVYETGGIFTIEGWGS